jgi:hypothetical protein
MVNINKRLSRQGYTFGSGKGSLQSSKNYLNQNYL